MLCAAVCVPSWISFPRDFSSSRSAPAWVPIDRHWVDDQRGLPAPSPSMRESPRARTHGNQEPNNNDNDDNNNGKKVEQIADSAE